MKNLYVIDGLINAYTLRKIEISKPKGFDIIAVVNTNLYDPDEYIAAIKNIIFPLICDRMFITSDNDWPYSFRRIFSQQA